MPFLGFATDELFSSDGWSDVTFAIESILQMPVDANFSIWTSGMFGEPNMVMSTALDEYSLSLPTGTHSHYNWGFTQQGVYEFEISATATRGGETFTDTGILTFGVNAVPAAVPEPGSLALLGLGFVGMAGGATLKRRRNRSQSSGESAGSDRAST